MLINDAMTAAAADTINEQMGSRLHLRWNEVAQHVPVELAERARAAATQHGIDAVVTIGGGSSTGLAKALALSHRVPIVAVPTTYAGSEQTTIYGLTGGQHKQTGKDPIVLPRVVVYDPELTLGLPGFVTGPSAFNALAHSVEALWAPGNNPITSALALEGVRAIARSLPTVMAEPADVDGRGDLLYGAALSGMALGATAAGLHHKLCHVLGGRFNLVHADAHSVVLPHALAFNAPVLPAEMDRLAEALGRSRTGSGGSAVGSRRRQQRPDQAGRPRWKRWAVAARPAARCGGCRCVRDHRQPAPRRPRRPARHPRARLRRQPSRVVNSWPGAASRRRAATTPRPLRLRARSRVPGFRRGRRGCRVPRRASTSRRRSCPARRR